VPVVARVFCWLIGIGLLLVASRVRAETLEAPVGGAQVILQGGRVACAPASGGWATEPNGRSVRPPSSRSAVGSVVELAVAASPAACANARTRLRLVATAPWPTFDADSFVLALDEGRLEGRGRGMRGVLVSWPTPSGERATDACTDPKPSGAGEGCTWAVPKSLPADPSATALHWLPAGARIEPDANLFDAEGRLASPQTFAIVPGRVELKELLPSDAAVDVSAGVGRVPLTHADAVSGVDCAGARCSVEGGVLLIQAAPASATSVDVKFHLVSHVIFAIKSPPDPQPTLRVSILRCPMTVVSGPALRAVDSARVIVRLEGACARDVASVRFLVGPRQADVAQTETIKDAVYVVLNVGDVDAPNLSIVAVRGEGEGTAVAVARTETRPAPAIRTVLEIPGFPPIDFIPNNRRAIVHTPRVDGAEFVVLSIENVYEAQVEDGVSYVQGDVDAAGAVTLMLGYRVPKLPAPLDKVNLAVLPDALHRSVKEASIPAPFGVSALSPHPLVELICTDHDGVSQRVAPGRVPHMSFSVREGCRLVFHRDQLSPEYGTQKLSLEVEVDKLDGTARSHVTQTIIMRSGQEPRIAWLTGVTAPYDRVVVRLSVVADEAHYLGALEIPTAPAAQWSIVFGTGRARLYATTAIPTGLYRFGTPSTSGVLSLSLAILSRLTWLDSEGHEGLLGLEAGIMAFGLPEQSTGGSLTQVGTVLGLGLSIPIAAAGSPTQASINLHGWFEERITGSGGEKSSEQAIIFGPSISVGNIGTTF